MTNSAIGSLPFWWRTTLRLARAPFALLCFFLPYMEKYSPNKGAYTAIFGLFVTFLEAGIEFSGAFQRVSNYEADATPFLLSEQSPRRNRSSIRLRTITGNDLRKSLAIPQMQSMAPV